MTTKRGMRRLAWGLALTAVAWLSAGPLLAQTQSAAEKLLLEKAHALEQSGHLDLAAQSWQQVLLSDPNSQQALAGLARWAKVSGNEAEAQKYIDRLRELNPNDPAIGPIQSLMSKHQQDALLRQASQLARAGQNEQALQLYHQAFGEHPPDNWALAYYDTEAAVPASRGDAIQGLRGLMKKFPGDPRYAIDLGRVLTYDAHTRTEGERLLRQYPQDQQAQTALRQALIWDVQNPASAPLVTEYLKQHPDEQLARELAATEAKQAGATRGLAKTPAEQQAFADLAGNHLDAAQRHFLNLQAKQPNNPRVLAGLGFLRMKQSNFAEAVSCFEQAQQNGLHTPVIAQSLATARFWYAMQEGTKALSDNRANDAVRQYKAALVMRPDDADALGGLAGAYMKAQNPALAIPAYQQLLSRQPTAEAAWRGLFIAQSLSGDGRAALATAQHFPPAVSKALVRDPDYLRALASAYSEAGETAQAERTLLEALNLGGNQPDARLEYARLLTQNGDYARAASVYRGLIDSDPENVSAWQGLVSLEHVAGQDPQAIALVERMPPTTYDRALEDGGFLGLLASIYQGQNHPDVAQQFLERAARLYQNQGEALPIPLQLQVAALDLDRNHPEAAYRIYRGILTQHPDRLDGWKGLLAALHQTGHDADALAQIEEIPETVRRALERDVQYQQTLAAVYASTGHEQAALGLTARVQEHYQDRHLPVPANVAIQNAWALFNTGDDADLYRQLMTLGDRTDMTDVQREQIQTIWASWAQRRATRAAEAGNTRRALQILTAAAQSFPGNPTVSKALAAGYAQAGQPRQAVAIYQSLDLTNASAADYQSMVGAALAAQNKKQAEVWLREALQRYPRDARVLGTAAQFETARGDTARAAEYWKASLNALPPVPPTAQLAHTLDQPDPVRSGNTARATDLASLLRPDSDASAQESGVPLPGYRHPLENRTTVAMNQAYGPDPLSMGTAPVQLNQQESLSPWNPEPAPERSQPSPATSMPPPPAAPAAVQPAPPRTHIRRRPTDSRGRMVAPGAPADQTPPPQPGGEFQPHATMDNFPQPSDPPQPAQAPIQSAAVASSRSEIDTEIAAAAQPADDASAREPSSVEAAAAHNAAQAQPLLFPATPDLDSETQPLQSNMAEKAPEQLGLDTSSAIEPLPNAGDRTRAQQPDLSYERPHSPRDAERAATAQTQTVPVTPGASDDQLMQENLPPLRGPYQRPMAVPVRTPREEAQQHLAAIEAGYSPWLGGTGFVNHRSGTAGYDSLTALEAPFEASEMLGTAARLTLVSKPVFLDAGAPNVSPILPGGVAERLGTAQANAILTQQNATGIGGELQLATPNFAASVGYTPYGFLVSNVIGRGFWKPGNGPFIFTFTRDSVKDSQLSYSGLRDPGSAAPGFAGNIWGGVVSTGGEVQFGKGGEASGFYVSAGGQSIDGYHVQTNQRIDGDAGAYWRLRSIPDEGNLTLGVNFFGMHYAHNLTYFTYGQGGYFSPQVYYLGGIPVTWTGRYGMNLHYAVVGSFGLQAFQEDSSPYFPLDTVLEVANNNPQYPSQTVVGGNYDLRAQGAYHMSDHWFVGGFLEMNNTRYYNNQQIGFSVRYLFRPQVETEAGPTGIYPWDGLRPYQAP